MTKTVEIDVSIREIMAITCQRWKLLLILAVICAVLGGGYGLHKAQSESKNAGPVTEEQQASYAKEMEEYGLFLESQKEQPGIIATRWFDLYEEQSGDPIYAVNPYRCEYDQIVVIFENNCSHDGTVKNWIAGADDKKLFGDQAETLRKYKNSIINTGDNSGDTQIDSFDTTVQLIGVEGFDTTTAAAYLVGLIKQQSISEGLDIINISTAHYSGYNKYVQNYQRLGREEITSIYNALNGISNMKNLIREPSQPQVSSPSSMKKVLKYGIAGLILGLLLGIGLAVFMSVRKGSVISCRQIENIFDLLLLSDSSRENLAAIEVLNANLDVLSGEESRILLTGDSEEEISAFASNCNSKGTREFMVGCNIFDDAGSIETLQDVDGIVLCVHLGSSRLDMIQRVLLRANKLGKTVLGYVLL